MSSEGTSHFLSLSCFGIGGRGLLGGGPGQGGSFGIATYGLMGVGREELRRMKALVQTGESALVTGKDVKKRLIEF